MNGKIWKIGLQKCAIGCMIGLLILISGCNPSQTVKVTDQESALAMLENLDSYEAQVQITFFSNKGENTYLIHQRAKASGEYHMEILEPESFAGVKTICDGSRVVQTDPTIGGEVEARPTPVREALVLYSFIEACRQNEVEVISGEKDTLILKTTYSGEHRKIVSGQLTLAKGMGTPLSLEICDGEDKPSLHMTYLTFQMNPELADENFKIAQK